MQVGGIEIPCLLQALPVENVEPGALQADQAVCPKLLEGPVHMHGRQAPVNNPVEDDQLEIPAFLRRQAN